MVSGIAGGTGVEYAALGIVFLSIFIGHMKKNPWAIGLLVLCLLCVAATVADVLEGDTDAMGGALAAVLLFGYGSWWAVLHKRTSNSLLHGPPCGVNAPLPTGMMLLGLLTVMMLGNTLGLLLLGQYAEMGVFVPSVLFFGVPTLLLARRYRARNQLYTQRMQELYSHPSLRGQAFFVARSGYMGMAMNVEEHVLVLVAHEQPMLVLKPADVHRYELLTDVQFVAGHVYAHDNHLHQAPAYHIASNVTLRLHLVGQQLAEFNVVFYEQWRYVEVKRRYRLAVLNATTWGYRLDRFLGR